MQEMVKVAKEAVLRYDPTTSLLFSLCRVPFWSCHSNARAQFAY